MAIIKCKMCGGDLSFVEGASVAECEYCGSKQTIPNQDNEKKLTLFARADRLRRACEFDKAAGVYESIVVDFPEEAEAYWGLVLCRYGIENIVIVSKMVFILFLAAAAQSICCCSGPFPAASLYYIHPCAQTFQFIGKHSSAPSEPNYQTMTAG